MLYIISFDLYNLLRPVVSYFALIYLHQGPHLHALFLSTLV